MEVLFLNMISDMGKGELNINKKCKTVDTDCSVMGNRITGFIFTVAEERKLLARLFASFPQS
jgi:hypothetical protein